MDCRIVQDQLFQSDDPSPGAIASPELAEHVAQCDSCRQLAGELVRLEQAWRAIPLPAGAEQARDAFLDRLARGLPQDVPAPGPRRWPSKPLRSPLRWLVAASVLLAVGVGGSLWLSTPKATASTDLVERLVDWNLSLTQAPSAADRSRIYSGQASTLREAVQKAALPDDDRELAESLLATAPWLTEHDDPLAEADRFNDMADKLMKRMSRATRGGDDHRAARYARLYRQVADRGIEPKVDALQKSGSLDFERRRRLERIILHDADRMSAVLALLEQAPDSTRKEIKQSLGILRKHPRKAPSTQAAEPGSVRPPRRPRVRGSAPESASGAGTPSP